MYHLGLQTQFEWLLAGFSSWLRKACPRFGRTMGRNLSIHSSQWQLFACYFGILFFWEEPLATGSSFVGCLTCLRCHDHHWWEDICQVHFLLPIMPQATGSCLLCKVRIRYWHHRYYGNCIYYFSIFIALTDHKTSEFQFQLQIYLKTYLWMSFSFIFECCQC